MKSKTIAKVGAFLTAFTVFAGSMLPVYVASVVRLQQRKETRKVFFSSWKSMEKIRSM